MEKTILNFHFNCLHTSLTRLTVLSLLTLLLRKKVRIIWTGVEWVTLRFYFDCLGHQEFKDIAHDGLWELTPLTLLPLLTLLKLLILLTLTLYYECFFGREVRFP